jgi:hypothetical protein
MREARVSPSQNCDALIARFAMRIAASTLIHRATEKRWQFWQEARHAELPDAAHFTILARRA